ncbi:MAG: LamG-like jellyroll fold domain-containing protein, partial [Deltaproteobacteria bacterium]
GSTQDNTTIFESFASIKVLGSSGVGGLIGFSAVNDNITTSYYDNETSSQNDTGKGFPRSKKQLEETQFAGGTVDGLQTFSNWNFDTIWQPRSNCRMPDFKQYLSFESECASFGENYFSGNSAPHHVSPYSNFQVGFNRPLNFLTIDNNSVYFSPYVKIAGYQYDNVSQILKITPSGPLDNNTNYTLTLTNNIRSIDNLSPSQINFSFTTNSDSYDLNQGLIAYYALDNNTFDYSGNGLDGIYINGASPTPDRFKASDKAAALSVSQYISVPDNNFLDLTDNFSVAAWIYPTAVGSGEQGIVSKYHSSASPLALELESDGSIASDGLNSSKTLDNNTWYHVGLTRGNNTLKLFINGEIVADNHSIGISNSINTDNLTIGSDFNGRYFQGQIDEVKIYNRVLTDDEVKAMYAIADTLGPIVLNSSPTNGASGFPAGDNLSVDFSEPLLASSINSNSVELKLDADNSTISPNNRTFDPNTNKLLFEPSSLGSFENYTLYLHSGIQDLAGNPLKATTISFQTSLLGSGTATDPYLINNTDSLNKIRDN